MCGLSRWMTIIVCLIAFKATAHAQNIFERMVMPGPLIEGHAKFEKECGKCHRPFSKKTQSRLCRDCHDKINADVEHVSGFHGLRKDIAKTECKHCHTDHIGRDADTTLLDPDTFDHHFTDFPLTGAHKPVACGACHKPKAKFRDAPHACAKCHEEDEPHKGRLGQKCESCHSVSNWHSTKPFDHEKTKFPLVDAHKKVGCALCHAAEIYKDLPTACVSCHRLQDVHNAKRGEKCETCHSPKEWKTSHFDHDKGTKFPLRHKHRETKCISCHKGAMFEEKLSTKCVSCHRADDAHDRQLGPKCADCHNEAGWRQTNAFDHEITRFPLIGQHTVVPCEECHITQKFKDAPLECERCHKDAFHEGRMGPGCASCHNPNGWVFWQFDHNTQTRYPLTGAHNGLDCHACHAVVVTDAIRLATDCYSCHRRDDTHDGAFGHRCDRCHTTKSFSGALIRR